MWNNPNPETAKAIVADEVVWHHPTFGEIQGREAMLEVIREVHTAYPGLRDTVIHMLADGDMVATHWSITGTHHKPYRGAAPSAKQLTWEGVTLHRVVDGRIVEMWGFPNTTAHGTPHEILHRQRAQSRP